MPSVTEGSDLPTMRDGMNDGLKPCQYDFFYNRIYDKQTDVIKYICKKNNSVIALINNSSSIAELCSMDKKVLEAVIPYCKGKCLYYRNSCT